MASLDLRGASELVTANPPLPPVLSPRVANRLPLEVGNRVWSAAGERLNVILAAARAGAARLPGRGARMLAEIRVYADVPTATADVT